MKKVFLACLLSSLFFVSCDTKRTYTAEEIKAETKKANDFFEKTYNVFLDRSPIKQSYLGIKKGQDKWDDISEESSKEELELSKKFLKELKDSINYDALDSQAKISYNLFKENAKRDIEGYKYRLYNYPVNQMHGWHSRIPSFLINMHIISDKKDAEDYLSRLKKIPFLFDQIIEGLELREKNGIVAPKFVFPRVIDDSKNVISGYPITNKEEKINPIYSDFKKKIDSLEIEPSVKENLLQRITLILQDNVKNAYEKLIVFLEKQSEISKKDAGVWKFPNGLEFYNYALRRTTTTDMSPEEVFEFGKSEIERIHGEMHQIMTKVGYEGDLQSFFKFMRGDDRFYYPNTNQGRKEYLSKAKELINNMGSRLDELFITKPKAKLIVKRVESFREKSAGTAFYNRPAPNGSRPGIYYANLYDMKNMPKYQMEALAYHEGIPGHHMQLALAQELEGIPKFRKYGGYTVYIEGWGLYSELIPKEMGLYEDTYSDFGRLAMELWRSCRLVVDVGIHTKKWTREDAIEFYKKNTPDSERDCERMVERHIVMPSQATAYKIGMHKIYTLREKAKKELGDKFDIKEFHDVILTNGALPLGILEDMVENYIAKSLN